MLNGPGIAKHGLGGPYPHYKLRTRAWPLWLCRTVALRWCLGRAKPAKCTSEQGWNSFSAVCAQPTQICRQDQSGSYHHTPHSQGLCLPPEHAGQQLTVTGQQRSYNVDKATQKVGRGWFLLRSLFDNIHHTLMVQWQKDPTHSLPNCTHNTYMHIHTHPNTYLCMHMYGFSTILISSQQGRRSIYNIPLQWWYLNWLLFQDTVTGKDLYPYHCACPCN